MVGEVPPAGAHGGDGARVAAALGFDDMVDLSASLNPLAPDPGAAVTRHLDALGRYPDPAAATAALAAAMGVDPDRLLLTNGGSEAIALVAAEVGGWVDEPEFSLHPRGDRTGPRWRSNPHNPTGRLAEPEERAGVWDEAFWPLATGTWTRGDGDTWVVGSLTKLLACPGLRVGYVLAPHRDGLAAVGRRQPEWSLNGLAAAALPDLLATVDLPGWTAGIDDLRAQLVDLLRTHGFEPSPSDACWVLVEAPGLRDRLARRGVLVRDCSSFGLPDHVRIAVPGVEGLERLGAALG